MTTETGWVPVLEMIPFVALYNIHSQRKKDLQ